MTTVINQDTFKEKIQESQQPSVVDVYADWCGPCKMMAPVMDAMAEKYQDKCGIFKLDIDQSPQIASQYGIASIPTLLFFKNGELVETMVGATTQEILEQKIENLIQ
jgi:thioredoxin 1